ncbi:type I restriction enzyme endonuclease domain-containing protein [Morganella morganii]|uniref:type I restriction enzyme endonuclease domain-containing protein n=1 Tax=Morganella morganii TaxID=582 RepID=UPI0032DA6BC7
MRNSKVSAGRYSQLPERLKRDSVRARMRNLVRRLLRRWKYPPDAAEDAMTLVLSQAEALADGWCQ